MSTYHGVDGDRVLSFKLLRLCSGKLPAVGNPHSELVGFGLVKLTWDSVDNAEGYLIYRQIGKTQFEYLYLVNKTDFTDTNPSLTDYNYYRIFPYVTVNGKIIPGQSTAYTTIRGALPPVSNLTAQVTGSAQVSLQWQGVTDAEHYLIYRSVAGGADQFLALTTELHYDDYTAENYFTNYYRVYAARKDQNNQWQTSQGIRVSATPRMTPIEDIHAEFGPSRASACIQWSRVAGAKSYAIFRKTAKSSLTYIGLVDANTEPLTFVDSYPHMGEFNFYFVKPVTYVNEQMVMTPTGGYDWFKPALDASQLLATGRTDGVYLYWQPVHRATSYVIERETENGGRETIARVTDPEYLDAEASRYVPAMYWLTPWYEGEDGFSQSAPTTALENPVRAKRSDQIIALTFDDGPSYGYTESILNTLSEYGVKATFFLQGHRIDDQVALVQRIAAEGHEIGNHGYDHPEFTSCSDYEIYLQISWTDEKIKQATGVTPKIARPPYGSWNNRVLYAIGKPVIIWNKDTEDWRYRDASHVYSYLLNNVGDGSVVLMHDTIASTAEGFRWALPELINQGYEFVTVSEMMEIYNKPCSPGVVFYGK